MLILETAVAINGSALVAGFESSLPVSVSISGGLAAGAGAFKQTWTIDPAVKAIKKLWPWAFRATKFNFTTVLLPAGNPFGPARKVARCDGNILYELDGSSAAAVYKRYLGDCANNLPGSGLLCPFAMVDSAHQKHGIFRTILAVDVIFQMDYQGNITFLNPA